MVNPEISLRLKPIPDVASKEEKQDVTEISAKKA